MRNQGVSVKITASIYVGINVHIIKNALMSGLKIKEFPRESKQNGQRLR